MPASKLIREIRYYESDLPNVDGQSLPGEIGQIYPFPATIHPLGVRIARKLREFGFLTGTFDHVYVNFTPLLPQHHASLSKRVPERWLRYVDYGLSPDLLPANTGGYDELVADATFRALRALITGSADAETQLRQAEREVRERGSEVEIPVLMKETTRYRIAITYQVRPGGGPSLGWIECEDRKLEQTGKLPFVQLVDYEDIYPLVGRISVVGGAITVSPRSSFKASVHTQHYQTPFVIALTDLLTSSHRASFSRPPR